MGKLPKHEILPFLEKIQSGEWFYCDGRIYRRRKNVNQFKTIELATPEVASKVCPQGYRRVYIKSKSYKEHRLIFAYFHGIDALLSHECIDHIDGNKQNNRIENLRGLTIKENTLEAEKLGLFKRTYGEINGCCKLKTEEVAEVRRLYELGFTQYEIADKYGVSQGHISTILNGKRRRYS